jgi:1-acyl-sn-glycerol-3-phosphate acyltransferase
VVRSSLTRVDRRGRSRPRRAQGRGKCTRRCCDDGSIAESTTSRIPPGAASSALERVEIERAREHLPAIEVERTVDDWGRSERFERAFDSTVVEFFYRYWFRCEVEDAGNVPDQGGALLVANHGGALPPDAQMIARALREEHPRGRRLYVTVEHFFKGYPGLAMLVSKIGGVPAHPANVHRLLADERELVLVFPEGRKATEKPVRDRYRLRRFGRGGFVDAALEAGVPIVPVCVVGAEEAMPVFATSRLLARLTGTIYFPITPTFPWLGPLGMLAYLPAKFRIRFLPPVDTAAMGSAARVDRGLVQSVSDEVRARIQEGLYEMLGKRRSVWKG